jgi:hypothetical protein
MVRSKNSEWLNTTAGPGPPVSLYANVVPFTSMEGNAAPSWSVRA